MLTYSVSVVENIKFQDLYIGLVKNQTWDVLDFFPNESIESQELKSLLIHLFILYHAAPENTGICEPFLNIFRCRQPLPVRTDGIRNMILKMFVPKNIDIFLSLHQEVFITFKRKSIYIVFGLDI